MKVEALKDWIDVARLESSTQAPLLIQVLHSYLQQQEKLKKDKISYSEFKKALIDEKLREELVELENAKFNTSGIDQPFLVVLKKFHQAEMIADMQERISYIQPEHLKNQKRELPLPPAKEYSERCKALLVEANCNTTENLQALQQCIQKMVHIDEIRRQRNSSVLEQGLKELLTTLKLLQELHLLTVAGQDYLETMPADFSSGLRLALSFLQREGGTQDQIEEKYFSLEKNPDALKVLVHLDQAGLLSGDKAAENYSRVIKLIKDYPEVLADSDYEPHTELKHLFKNFLNREEEKKPGSAKMSIEEKQLLFDILLENPYLIEKIEREFAFLYEQGLAKALFPNNEQGRQNYNKLVEAIKSDDPFKIQLLRIYLDERDDEELSQERKIDVFNMVLANDFLPAETEDLNERTEEVVSLFAFICDSYENAFEGDAGRENYKNFMANVPYMQDLHEVFYQFQNMCLDAESTLSPTTSEEGVSMMMALVENAKNAAEIVEDLSEAANGDVNLKALFFKEIEKSRGALVGKGVSLMQQADRALPTEDNRNSKLPLAVKLHLLSFLAPKEYFPKLVLIEGVRDLPELEKISQHNNYAPIIVVNPATREYSIFSRLNGSWQERPLLDSPEGLIKKLYEAHKDDLESDGRVVVNKNKEEKVSAIFKMLETYHHPLSQYQAIESGYKDDKKQQGPRV